MLQRAFAAAALMVAGLCSAFAADLPIPYKVQPAQRGVNWTGWFGGASIGYVSSDVSSFIGTTTANIQLDPSGFEVALHGGYDYQLPNSNLVFGAEVTLPLLRLKDTQNDPLVAGASYSTKSNWAVLVTGKVGYSIGNWLPYIGGGVGFINATGRAIVPGFASVDSDNTHVGGIFVAGVRYMLDPNWWVGLQYMHGEYSTETYRTFPQFAPASDRNIGFSTDAVALQFAYRFTAR